ncbi:uncharacterized protein A4U43_C05F27640 [Asparagus officinalis]|uniref:ABC-2 type transporter transmembrane domain-containing protein n=1 Tax=Asparagus officinalis TaxID=4686 RepID=A0A5P1F0C0_ASPOF|nr:uncharacterized protein A4U43_C05F27640 [Asparagus officinalis]
MAVLQGKTVILTIHQPGFRILDLFDRILLISNGSVKHHGSLPSLEAKLIESGHSIPPHVNVLEFAMDAVETLPSQVMAPSPSMSQREFCDLVPKEARIYYANSRFNEVRILTARFFKNVLRTRQLSSARMLQCVLAGFALGTIFMNVDNISSRVGFFAFTLTFLLSSTRVSLFLAGGLVGHGDGELFRIVLQRDGS